MPRGTLSQQTQPSPFRRQAGIHRMRRQKSAFPSQLVTAVTVRPRPHLSGRNAMSAGTTNIPQEAVDGAIPTTPQYLRRMKAGGLVRRPLSARSTIAVWTSEAATSGTLGVTFGALSRASARPPGVGSFRFAVGVQLLAAATASATICRTHVPGVPMPQVQTFFGRRDRLAFADSHSPIRTTSGYPLCSGRGVKVQNAKVPRMRKFIRWDYKGRRTYVHTRLFLGDN